MTQNITSPHIVFLPEGACWTLRGLLTLHWDWSLETFGSPAPSGDTTRLCNHITAELDEVQEAQTTDEEVEEWMDVAILAFDGALRVCGDPAKVAEALAAKIQKNRERKWPKPGSLPPGEPICHLKPQTPQAESPLEAPGPLEAVLEDLDQELLRARLAGQHDIELGLWRARAIVQRACLC